MFARMMHVDSSDVATVRVWQRRAIYDENSAAYATGAVSCIFNGVPYCAAYRNNVPQHMRAFADCSEREL